jgi:flavin reductase (DIM6/NTAB) family NADH-FMN oxidoreductase RutF
MELDLEGQHASRAYPILASLVTPRPIALVTTRGPAGVVNPPRIAEAPASLECAEWGTLQIGANRVVIGVVKRVHLRDEYFDRETQRVLGEKLMLIGRTAAPHWYCRTRDRFEMPRPD